MRSLPFASSTSWRSMIFAMKSGRAPGVAHLMLSASVTLSRSFLNSYVPTYTRPSTSHSIGQMRLSLTNHSQIVAERLYKARAFHDGLNLQTTNDQRRSLGT